MESKKQLTGIVVSSKMKHTVIVAVTQLTHHPKYNKTIKKTRKYAVHSDRNDIAAGMKVTIEPIRPMSKTKHYRLVGSVTG